MVAVSTRTSDIARDWVKNDYYDKAESDAWTEVFWRTGTQFRRMFEKLNTASMVELACGHGRHSARILASKQGKPQSLILLDVVKENISHCSERFSKHPEVSAYTNNGHDFQPVADNSVSAVFCFDAMVHFEYDAVISYIQDTSRILKRGGRGLFHHSNLDKNPGLDYQDNPHWRNFMSKNLFAHAANRAGLILVEQVTIDWDNSRNIDCLTLVEKPSDGSIRVKIPKAQSSSNLLPRVKQKIRSIVKLS